MQPHCGVVWMSFHQLLLDYQKSSGRLGPYTPGRNWAPRPVHITYDYKQQVQWFARFLQSLAKAGDQPLETEQRRPNSLTIAFWCGCVKVHMDERRRETIDDHYKQFARGLPARQIGRDLAEVPPFT